MSGAAVRTLKNRRTLLGNLFGFDSDSEFLWGSVRSKQPRNLNRTNLAECQVRNGHILQLDVELSSALEQVLSYPGRYLRRNVRIMK